MTVTPGRVLGDMVSRFHTKYESCNLVGAREELREIADYAKFVADCLEGTEKLFTVVPKGS